MAALPSVASVIRCQLVWTDGADIDSTNVFYFRYSGGPPSVADLNAMATSLLSEWEPYNEEWHSDTELTGVKLTDLTSPSSASGEASGGVVGDRGGTPLAGGTAVVVSFQIPRRYRGGRPRVYLPWGTSTDLQTRQSWTAAFITVIGTAISGWLSAAVGTEGGSTTLAQHVNVSYYAGSRVVISPTTGRARNVATLRSSPQVDNIGGFSVLGRPGSQRRRNRV